MGFSNSYLKHPDRSRPLASIAELVPEGIASRCRLCAEASPHRLEPHHSVQTCEGPGIMNIGGFRDACSDRVNFCFTNIVQRLIAAVKAIVESRR